MAADISNYQLKDIRANLDEPTTDALQIVEEIMPVEFRIWDKHEYGSLIKTINVPSPFGVILFYEPLSLPKIFHELMHLHCSICFGYNSCMLPKEDDHYWYKYLLTEDFCEYFLNNAEHTVIQSYYINAGYQPEDFFESYTDPSEKVKQFLSMTFKANGKYSAAMITNYMRLCTHLLSFPFDKRYLPLVKRIKMVDYPLFTIFNKFFRDYFDTEILEDNGDYIQQCYQEFREGIDRWIRKNQNNILIP